MVSIICKVIAKKWFYLIFKGTCEDLKSYTKEVKDYIQTELGQESDIHMFLKCFPELYEKLAVKHSPNLDINLSRKANTYFTNCFYVPFKRDQSLTQPLFHCKHCKGKLRSLFDLIQHQRTEHGVNFKAMFEMNNIPARTASSPVGYLRCDPFAYILNLYWDMTYVKECEICKKRFIRGIHKRHVDSCGSIETSESLDATLDEVVAIVVEDELPVGVAVKEEPILEVMKVRFLFLNFSKKIILNIFRWNLKPKSPKVSNYKNGENVRSTM